MRGLPCVMTCLRTASRAYALPPSAHARSCQGLWLILIRPQACRYAILSDPHHGQPLRSTGTARNGNRTFYLAIHAYGFS